MSRPSSFTQETADAICQRMAQGESLRQICRDDSMPCLSTVMKWAADIEAFSEQYARAREALREHWAEEILEIADDGSNDWIKRELGEGRVDIVQDTEHVNRSRLRIDARKWLLSKLAPKKYGDRVDLTHSGPDGGPIKTVTIGASVDPAEASRIYLDVMGGDK